MLDEASDDKDAVRLHRRPHLPHTDSVATHTVTAADRDADVGEVATVAHLPPAFIARRAPPIIPLMVGRAPGYTGLPPAAGGGYYAPPPQTQQAFPTRTS